MPSSLISTVLAAWDTACSELVAANSRSDRRYAETKICVIKRIAAIVIPLMMATKSTDRGTARLFLFCSMALSF